MSGGIDSSVCGMLLMDKGFKVQGVTYRTYDSVSKGCLEKETGCCTVESIMEAKHLAEKLGIEHTIIDLRAKFKETIIADFVNEYLAGRTPNPCVVCNSSIKWGQLLKIADELGCEKIATGHYAQVKHENGRYFLSMGVDLLKDQSYFLWNLSQEDLSRTLFPIGAYTKPEIRSLAGEKGFVKLSQKKESQEICFIPDDDYRRFLNENEPDKIKQIGEGDFVLADGTVVGKHLGYPFYTIGQRKGLGVALGEPYFVTKIDAESNKITLGKRTELEVDTVFITKVNLMKYAKIPESGLEVDVKIRYRSTAQKAIVKPTENGLRIQFSGGVSAVTPGQSAVFYEGTDVVGGGVIDRAICSGIEPGMHSV